MKKLAFLPPQKIKDVILNIYNKFGNGKPINIQTNKDISEYLKKQNLSLSLLMRSIKEHFRGKPNLDIKLGFERIHKDWDEPLLEKEYGAECRNHGNVALSFDFLNNIGRSDIVNTFRRLRIDKNEFDKRLGFKPLQRNTSWTTEEILFKFPKVCDELNGGKPLGDDELIKHGHGDLNAAIHVNFDSKYELYELLGMGFIRRDHWTYNDYLNSYKESVRACGNRSLSQKDLKDLGKGYLNNWINRNFDSKDELDKLCGTVSKASFRLSNGSCVRSGYEVKLGNFLIHNKIPFENEGVIDQSSRIKYRERP